MIFKIDGVEKGSWSGEEGWSEVRFAVNEGTRTFEWTYSKDGSDSAGEDTAWIDDIIFPIGLNSQQPQPEPQPTGEICPDCGGEVRRLLGVPALQFKGSGWYVTDYGKGNNGAGASSSKPTSKNSDSKEKDSASTPVAKKSKTTQPAAKAS